MSPAPLPTDRRTFSPACWAILSLPAVLAFASIMFFAVEVPILDDWNEPGNLYENMIDGELTFGHLFSQHNEHRLAFPRIFYLILAVTVGWNIKAILILSWVTCLATLIVVLSLLARFTPTSSMRFWVALLISAAIFSPAQSSNQLWAIMWVVFIPPLCLAGSLLLNTSGRSLPTKVLACSALSFIATFSFANGMVCWVLGCPLGSMLCRSASRRAVIGRLTWVGIYFALAAATIYFYFLDYQAPSVHQSGPGSAQGILFGAQFLATWIGAPFTFYAKGAHFAAIVGCAVAVTLLSSLVYVLRRSRLETGWSLFKACYPFGCLVAYGVVSGLVTASGRMHLGQHLARAARYSTTSLWVAVGLLPILYAIHVDARSRMRHSFSGRVPAIVIALATLMLLPTWIFGCKEMRAHSLRLEQNLLTLRLFDVAPQNPLLLRLYPIPRDIRKRASLLQEHGFLDYEPIGPWVQSQIRTSVDKGLVSPGSVRIRKGARGGVLLSGWAVLPEQDRPADCVLITAQDATGAATLLSGLTTKDRRPDIAEQFANPKLLYCGFGGALKIAKPENFRFHAFAADFENQRVYAIPRSP